MVGALEKVVLGVVVLGCRYLKVVALSDAGDTTCANYRLVKLHEEQLAIVSLCRILLMALLVLLAHELCDLDVFLGHHFKVFEILQLKQGNLVTGGLDLNCLFLILSLFELVVVLKQGLLLLDL